MRTNIVASRLLIIAGIAIALSAIGTVTLVADIKTQEKTSFQMGGAMGGLINKLAGDAAKDGIVSSVAVRGSRKMTSNEATGRIIDLAEEKVYDIDYRKKEYRVTTFAELRKRWEDAQEKAKKDVSEMNKDEKPDPRQEGRQYEVSFDVKQTGQNKTIAGYNAREVIVTVTMHEKGKTLEEGGGLVMTNGMWIAPKIAEMDESLAFDVKFAKAIYGDLMPSIDAAHQETWSMLLASYPSFKEMSEKMAAEAKKLEGTLLASTSTLEAVKSAEQMAAAPAASASQGGGIAGRLAARMLPKPKPGEQKTKAFSSSSETMSISMTVTDSDTAVPASFKEKK